MKRHIVWIAILGSLALAAPAGAQPPTSETITFNWQIDSFPAQAPYDGTGFGSFSASGSSFTDSGAMSVAYHLGAAPSPTVGVLQTERTLVGAAGTITLRCHQLATDFSNPAAVPNSGSCTVIGGTGAYASLHGEGTITGVSNLSTLPATLTDVLQLEVH